MAPVHNRATALAVGSCVELGSCFGFLSLRLAAAGPRVTAVDLVPGTVRLLARTAAVLEIPVTAVAGNATAVPLVAGSADTVFAVHLPEGATVAVPAGFDAEEVFALLTVVREALR